MELERKSVSEIVIPAGDIQGNPKPKSLAQWVPHEVRSWWTEEALAGKQGLQPDRTTGRLVERDLAGWRLRILSDAERSALFLNGSGRSSA